MIQPPIVRYAGFLVAAEAVAGLVMAVVLTVLATGGTDKHTEGFNAYGTAGWFALMGLGLLAGGWALIRYIRWPLITPTFFFILVNNLLGLIPLGDLMHIGSHYSGESPVFSKPWIGGTATQNFFVTLTLAVIAGLVFNIAAIMRLGVVGFVKHMLGGLPLVMFPIALLLFIIEAAGQFIIKPFALALRLFANMTAGHVMLATMLGFGGKAFAEMTGGHAGQGVVGVIWVVSAMAITFLELFVAFLQAFVFMFLTTIFISLMDHHDEHGHEHEHDHAHGHEHAHA